MKLLAFMPKRRERAPQVALWLGINGNRTNGIVGDHRGISHSFITNIEVQVLNSSGLGSSGGVLSGGDSGGEDVAGFGVTSEAHLGVTVVKAKSE